MHYRKGKDREQVFMTSMENWVREDSWARVVDLFVDAMPVREFGFRHAELNKEGNIRYDPELVEQPFGTIKRHWGMDYTYLRGSPKVVAEYTLATICYNLMRMMSVKGIKWVEKRLKRLHFKVFAIVSAYRVPCAQGNHVALWWMSVVFYIGFVKFTEGERVVA